MIDKTLKVKTNSFSLTLQRGFSNHSRLEFQSQTSLHKEIPFEEGMAPSAVALHGKGQSWMLKDRQGFIINSHAPVPIQKIIISKHRKNAICASSPNRQLLLPIKLKPTFGFLLPAVSIKSGGTRALQSQHVFRKG